MKILFDEIKHKYFLEGTDKLFTSVTALVDSVSNKFNAEEAAAAFVTSKNNKENWEYERILKEWKLKGDQTRERGILFHSIKEKEAIANGGFGRENQGGMKVINLDYLKNLPNGEHCELIIPHIPSWTIGTADKVSIKGKKFFITDYKCVEELEFESGSYFDKLKKKKVKKYLKPPVGHIEDCKGMKYFLQMSLYSYYLECLGYTFQGGVIEQALFDKKNKYIKSIEHPMIYLKKEAESILKFHKIKNS